MSYRHAMPIAILAALVICDSWNHLPAAPPQAAAAQPRGDDAARSWPRFRGSDGSGISPYANVPDDWDGRSGKNILWKTPIPLPGNSSPVIVAGRIFLTGADETKRQVYCFDAASGKPLWQADVPSTPESNKLELKDSQQEVPGYAAPTMATDGRYVAAIFANGDMACFDLNGKLAWSKSLGVPENPYGHAASLASYKNLLIVPFDQALVKSKKSKIRAIDFAGGRVVWERSRPVKSSWTSPIVVPCRRPRSVGDGRGTVGDRLRPGRRQGVVASEDGRR
jgi:hypothetical protein